MRVQPWTQMVVAIVSCVTIGLTAPGVTLGFGVTVLASAGREASQPQKAAKRTDCLTAKARRSAILPPAQAPASGGIGSAA